MGVWSFMRLRIIVPDINRLKKDFDSNLPFGLTSYHLLFLLVGIVLIGIVFFILSMILNFTNTVTSTVNQVLESSSSSDLNNGTTSSIMLSSMTPLVSLIPIFVVMGVILGALRLIGGRVDGI